MATGPWSNKFAGAHILLTEPGIQGGSWDNIPDSWNSIRFDAVDVLFISPFFVNASNFNIALTTPDGASLLGRFSWVIRAARSKNPQVKIILEQFYLPSQDFQLLGDDTNKINTYASSVASFVGDWYARTLPSIDGNSQVSARIDGWDVDVESDTLVPSLPQILTAVRSNLNALAGQLGTQFSVSITPAWTEYLNGSVAQSCDYINMQNYSGGEGTSPEDYLSAVPGLQASQLNWGIASETPNTNTLTTFAEVKDKAQAVANGQVNGIYTWRLNSDNYIFENIFQVWLYNTVHGVTLPDSQPESVVAQEWPTGGRS